MEERKPCVELAPATCPQEGVEPEPSPVAGARDEVTNYLKGWPLIITTFALSLAVFLASLEVSIVATSLVAITDDMRGFNRSSWIVTAYMLTYTGFLIIWAKFSDIFGRKLLIVVSLGLFTIFSGACGAAQTVDQLIILRAMQGIGGAGTYSLVFVIFFELVPPEKFAPYSSMLSSVFAIALLLGPLLGGVINNFTTWRWVFLINVPAGAVSIILLLVAIPRSFPYHGLPEAVCSRQSLRHRFTRAQLGRIDYLGTTLLLSATVLLVTALEETGTQFQWKSPFIIAILVLSGLSWVAFLAWSKRITSAGKAREPVFPWRFVQSRVCMGLLLEIFLTGAPFTVAVIQLPLKFQSVYGESPLGAGVRLLPFAILSPVGSGVAAALAGRGKLPPIHIFVCGSAMQIVAFALLGMRSNTQSIEKAQYGYEAIAGFAVGINLACMILMAPFVVEKRDKSVAMSAVIQFRTMGGAIGLAIVTNVMNAHVRKHLAETLAPAQITALLETTKAFAALSPETADIVRTAFAHGYNLQMQIMIGFSAAQIPAAILMWKKPQVLI